MSDGWFALIGVFIGTASTVGWQAWVAKRQARVAREAAQSSASAGLLDAFWDRLRLSVYDSNPTPADERKAFRSWARARTRFLEAGFEDALITTTWLDLFLTDVESDTFSGAILTWHDAIKKHGYVTEALGRARAGDSAAIEGIRTDRKRLSDKYW